MNRPCQQLHGSRRGGFTLIEVLLASTLSVALMVLLVQLFSTGSKQAQETMASSSLQRQARPALAWLEADFRLLDPSVMPTFRRLGEDNGELTMLVNDRRVGQIGERVIVRYYTAVRGENGAPAAGVEAMRRLYRQRIGPAETFDILAELTSSKLEIPLKLAPDPQRDDLVAERIGAFRLRLWRADSDNRLHELNGAGDASLSLLPQLLQIELVILTRRETTRRAAAGDWDQALPEGLGQSFLLRLTP